MPIDYQRDDDRRLITITVTEPFSFEALLDQTDRQWAENTWGYAVLYDSRETMHTYPPSEIERLLSRSQIVAGGRPRGPVGVAIPPRAEMFKSGLQLAKQGGPLRDIEILMNVEQIGAWIARHAPRRKATRN
jgi:hypothetical protein